MRAALTRRFQCGQGVGHFHGLPRISKWRDADFVVENPATDEIASTRLSIFVAP
jgi:hypothetical protein